MWRLAALSVTEGLELHDPRGPLQSKSFHDSMILWYSSDNCIHLECKRLATWNLPSTWPETKAKTTLFQKEEEKERLPLRHSHKVSSQAQTSPPMCLTLGWVQIKSLTTPHACTSQLLCQPLLLPFFGKWLDFVYVHNAALGFKVNGLFSLQPYQ